MPVSRSPSCRNLGFQMRALSASAIRRPLTWLLSERYIRARSLLLYPYVFVAGPNKHDPFIELVTERKFQQISGPSYHCEFNNGPRSCSMHLRSRPYELPTCYPVPFLSPTPGLRVRRDADRA